MELKSNQVIRNAYIKNGYEVKCQCGHTYTAPFPNPISEYSCPKCNLHHIAARCGDIECAETVNKLLMDKYS